MNFIIIFLNVPWTLATYSAYATDLSNNVPRPKNAADAGVAIWLTKPDKSALFQRQNTTLSFASTSNQYPTITVDDTETYQDIAGFGNCLTGGSATLINSLPAVQQDALLRELFLTDDNSIGISYLRISLGASDLSEAPFTYDDMPSGQTDPTLQHFSIAREQKDLIPVLKKISALNPAISILACPWTAPPWMKSNNDFKGGSLLPEYYAVYAQYFVKYIQAMKAEGITIAAVTSQNEPLNPYNNPALVMTATEQANFIKNHLGPAFQAAGLRTKIIAYDHNADRPDYPIEILNDPDARGAFHKDHEVVHAVANRFIDGSAFHLYGGSIAALTAVHNAFPNKNVYFTEQWVGGPGNFAGDLQWHIRTLIIGATRNWSRNVLEWNMAADANYGPHTDGGCSTCLGALTINGADVTRNVAYYIIAHASKFARPGSVRIGSNVVNQLENVAFKTMDGKKVLIVLNDANGPQIFNIKYNGQIVTTELVNGAVATYVW